MLLDFFWKKVLHRLNFNLLFRWILTSSSMKIRQDRLSSLLSEYHVDLCNLVDLFNGFRSLEIDFRSLQTNASHCPVQVVEAANKSRFFFLFKRHRGTIVWMQPALMSISWSSKSRLLKCLSSKSPTVHFILLYFCGFYFGGLWSETWLFSSREKFFFFLVALLLFKPLGDWSIKLVLQPDLW